MEHSLLDRKQNLSSTKQRLLAERLRGETAFGNSLSQIASLPRPKRLPLSYAQQRLWFINQLEGTGTEYNMPAALRLLGELDVDAMQRTINTIVARHESLRTHFAQEEGEPVQVIEPEVKIALPVEDLSGEDELAQKSAVRQALEREWKVPFDLGRGPLLRVKLLKLGEQEHVLLRTMHHIVSDGWSQGVFNQEFKVLYEAYRAGRENPLPALRVQYADFALWQREQLNEAAMRRGLEYWKQELAGIPEQMQLPKDRSRPAVQTFAAEICEMRLGVDEVAGLKRLSQKHQATPYMTLLAGFAVLMARYSGQDDIVVGSPIANRQEAQLEELIGFFVNSLVMRVRVRGEMSFGQLLMEVRRVALGAYEHQDVPFERLVEELAPERSLNRTPVFQVMFAVQNAPMGRPQFAGLEVESDDEEAELQVRFDLEVHAWEAEGEIRFFWIYNRDLFDRWRMEQMVRHYRRLLEQVVADAGQPVEEIELLFPEERRRILEEWNDTAQPLPSATIPELFERQAEQTPEAVAVVFEQQQLSYGELNRRANRLAHHLISEGVGPENVVALALPRSPEMVIALLATAKAGAAYLPLDLDYPPERLAFMLKDANPSCLVAGRAFCAAVPFSGHCVLLDDPRILDQVEQRPTVNPTREGRLTPENLAYVLYTSGSTGVPKGVMTTHGAVLRLVHNANYVDLKSPHRMAQVSKFSFDASTFEVWGALLNGGRLVMIAKDVALDPEGFSECLRTEGITTMFLTASLFNELVLQNQQVDSFAGLEELLVGGEALDPERVWQALNHGGPRRLLNAYGPTETTTFATTFAVRNDEREAETIPIGKPIANTRAYVLDENLRSVCVGVVGELYIAGLGLARGYMKRPGPTAERFVADPHGEPGARMYRTGDLVRWRADGALEFLGRADQQIKIRGFRVELEEIEAVLRRHDGVQNAIVVARGEGSEKQLLGYVTPKAGQEEQERTQAEHLEQWRQLYESTYGEKYTSALGREGTLGLEVPGDFNIVGWESSYTGKPIAAREMQIWVDETVAHLRRLQPKRVLEVGCGTGLLLTRLAGACDRYVGVDFSENVLAQLRSYLATRPDLRHVELRHGLAHELSFLADNSVDLTILNSVVQYFPDIDYLLTVLQEAVRVTKHDGHIFLGDLRSLPLLEAFHTSVRLYKAAERTSILELCREIRREQQREEELVVSAELFHELCRRWNKIRRVETWLKTGAYDNEVSRFRYDVVLRMAPEEAPDLKEEIAPPEQCASWDEGGCWLESVKDYLAREDGKAVGVRGIRDLRVASSVEAIRLLHGGEVSDVEHVRARCDGISGEDPDRVMQWARQQAVEFCWQGFTARGTYDGVFRPRWRVQPVLEPKPQAYYRRYGNTPARRSKDRELGWKLRDYLAEKLPEYMVPAVVMVLPSFPLTPTGKVDHKALPSPELVAAATYRPPQTAEQELLCALFAEVLGADRVGMDDNFFELGGHSLMATRLVSRIRAVLRVEIAIRMLFESPTVEKLHPRLKKAGSGIRSPLEQVQRPQRLPLSYAQQRLWFINQLEGTGTEYNVPESLRLVGELDVDAMQRTINTIVARHESLRTHFAQEEGEPVQVIEAEVKIALPVEDLSREDELAQKSAVRRALEAEWKKPFDLGRGPLLRVKLLKLGEQEHVLLRTMHHIVSDGWSQGVFNQEFKVLYEAYRAGRENPLPALRVQYADFALWQREQLNEAAMRRGLEYWKQELAGIPEQMQLPKDRLRPAVQTFAAEICEMKLGVEEVAGLKRLSQKYQATPYMTLLAGFAVLMARYSGQDDIVVGSPIANRQEAQLEELIGFFVNSLVMRVRVRGEMSFGQLLMEVRRVALGAYEHQDVPFERLVEELAPERSLNRTPVFQVMFAVQNAPGEVQTLPGLRVEQVGSDSCPVAYDLEVHAWEADGEIQFFWIYNRDLFDRWRMEQMVQHYRRLLEQVVADAGQPVGEIELLFPEERRRILEEWNDTAQPLPSATIPELFERQAEQTPEAVAVVFEQQQLSYGELNRRANRLAHHLISEGVGPENVVALALPRSPEMVIALLATAKAGAAYLPLDLDYPPERLAFMLKDANPSCLIASAEARAKLPNSTRQIVLNDLARTECLDRCPESNPTNSDRVRPLHPENVSYIVYTSGSTGEPKGVVVTQAALANKIITVAAKLEVSQETIYAATTSVGFDPFIEQVFCPLCAGARVLIVPDGVRDGGQLRRYLSKHQVSIVDLTPALVENLLEGDSENLLERDSEDISTLIIGGDVLTSDVANKVRDSAVARRILNFYGPTEACIDAAAYVIGEVSSSATVPIGSPLPNYQLHVLDEHIRPLPAGVRGELYIAGSGLARGYLQRPGLTAERFVANPFGPAGSRMYRTGDLARWRTDGTLEFIGRSDRQIKVRGCRVEPGEIEAALRRCGGVTNAVVISAPGRDGKTQLIAYCTANRYSDSQALLEELRRTLPEHMIPSSLMVLPVLPLLPSGKIDRNALPVPDFAATAAYRHPQTAEEQALCDLFANVLGVKRVGLDDNFFELGGHSMAMLRLLARIQSFFNIDIPLPEFFANPTAANVALGMQQRRSPARLDEHEEPFIDLNREAVLDASFARNLPTRTPTNFANVLLTGASGFLGTFLLAELLASSESQVSCLVRTPDVKAGKAKLIRQLLQMHGFFDEHLSDRIVVIPGDLSQPRLGLSEKQFERVSEEVDVIYHSAAVVNAIYPYDALKPVNVVGTLEVLRMAVTARLKPFHFISTLSVTEPDPPGKGPWVIREEDPLPPWEHLHSGYAQSKWVAEKLVAQAAQRGVPTTVYRPAFITGDTKTGIGNSADLFWQFIRSCAETSCFPDIDFEMNMVPVDYVSKAVVALSRCNESAGRVFHLANPCATHMRDVLESMASAGYPLERVSAQVWKSRTAGSKTIFPMLSQLTQHAAQTTYREPEFRCTGAFGLLRSTGIHCPPITDALLQLYLSRLFDRVVAEAV